MAKTTRRSKALQIFLAVTSVTATATLAGCAAGENPSTATPSAPTNSPTVSESPALQVPDGASAQGVVLAAFILKNGDIVRAVEEGLVTPIEVELARTALRDGTLQQWVDAAG